MNAVALSALLKISSWENALLLSSNKDNERARSVFSKGNLHLQVGLLLDTTKKADQEWWQKYGKFREDLLG